jgi:glycosyltransferase involved in cell wall biosynthesis
MKIGILGTRGIPNHYGGFEHIAAYLAKGLVERGHEVTVYNSHKHPFRQKAWHGVKIIHCFDPEFLIGGAGQFIYDLNCILDARKRNYDIILMLGYTSSSVWGSLYPRQSIVITNMDGLEWKRAKFSKPVRRFLRYAEKLAVRFSHFHIADSPVIKEYLDDKYGISSKYIAYGAGLQPSAVESHLFGYGLKKQQYLLLMARMEPENNIELILDGYCQSKKELRFIVIGNTGSRYGKYLTEKYRQEEKIIFLGAIFDEEKVQTLSTFCSLYFHGHSVGGTNPSLLDTMASRAPIAAHDNAFNKSVLEENALFFSDPDDISRIIDSKEYRNELHILNNYAKIENEFGWKMIINQYENYFNECCLAKGTYYELSNDKAILLSGQYTE